MPELQTMSRQQNEILEEDIRRNIDLFEKVVEVCNTGKPNKRKRTPKEKHQFILVPT
ncbi:MAG: hypothetical protein JSV69_04670 [Chloroflexota bacterium]|nr:MAG: hypothetical protein JSV69_04670 [Chloroflexota bacterium]